MKDVLVVYKSRYGAAERYAKWIAEALDARALPLKQVTTAVLLKYRMLIFGGGLYMGRINGVAALTRRFQELKDKTLFVFRGGGGTEPEDDGYYTFLYTRNFTEKMRKQIHFFAFPGAVDGQKLGRFHRWMMGMVMKERARKDPRMPGIPGDENGFYRSPVYRAAGGKGSRILQEWDEKGGGRRKSAVRRIKSRIQKG